MLTACRGDSRFINTSDKTSVQYSYQTEHPIPFYILSLLVAGSKKYFFYSDKATILTQHVLYSSRLATLLPIIVKIVETNFRAAKTALRGDLNFGTTPYFAGRRLEHNASSG